LAKLLVNELFAASAEKKRIMHYYMRKLYLESTQKSCALVWLSGQNNDALAQAGIESA
jgi:hypothetical protein